MEMKNHKYYVSYEVAELLEKAGFGWRYKPFETKIGNTVYNQVTLSDQLPTIEEAQRWLRETKDYYVNIDADCDSTQVFYTVQIVYFDIDDKYYYHKIYIHEKDEHGKDNHRRLEVFNTYEEAQEAGIKKALEILLNKRE